MRRSAFKELKQTRVLSKFSASLDPGNHTSPYPCPAHAVRATAPSYMALCLLSPGPLLPQTECSPK